MLKSILRARALQTAAAWIATNYVIFVALTTRWRIEGPGLLAFVEGPPCIVVFWHETLPSMPYFWLRAGQLGPRRPSMVLASRHRDGQLIGLAVRNLGIGLISGSSSRGGAAGLRGLLTALEAGCHVGLTPDGPRGPRRVAAAGVAQVAAMSGAKVLPCAAHMKWAWTLRSWDQMRLPLPFGRGVLVGGALVTVSRQDWEGGLATIEAALNDAILQAETLA